LHLPSLFIAGVLFTPAVSGIVFYWFICFLTSSPYLFLPISYRRTLKYKLRTVESLMTDNSIFQAYIKKFGTRDGPDAAITELFGLIYHWRIYALAMLFNIGVVTVSSGVAIIRAGISLGLPSSFEGLISHAPVTILFSLGGAYVLGLYDMLRRYRVGDLYPTGLHFYWLHMVVAAFLGPLLAQAFKPGVGMTVAFGIGIFPLKESLEVVKKYASKRLKLSSEAPVGEGATLNKIQGLTPEIIERFEEEGVTSTVHLAYSDPIKLLLRTNIPWVIIIDLMDQAILFNYLGESAACLRPLGIRGSIELAALGQRLYKPRNEEDERCAPLAIHLIAERLASSDDAALALIRTLYEDGQVDLLWELYTPETPVGVMRAEDQRAAKISKTAEIAVAAKGTSS
jgi:hypothetical protein